MGDPDLNSLQAFIADHYRFDSAAYPELAGSDEQRCRRFGLQHVTFHLIISAAEVAKVCERAGHDPTISSMPTVETLRNLLIDTLRLAQIVGVTGTELSAAIERKFDAEVVKGTERVDLR